MCKPYVTGPTPIICPGNNETLDFTCRDSQVLYLSWSFQPNYTRDPRDRFTYSPATNIGRKFVHSLFTAILVDVSNVSNSTSPTLADMVSTLTVSIDGLLNNTIISCITRQNILQSEQNMSITLILAGICTYRVALS